MAIQQATQQVPYKYPVVPGPLVNGAPSALHMLGQSDLTNSSLLVPLFNMFNHAFGTSHTQHPPWIPYEQKRFDHPSDIPRELGPGITYIITSVPDPEIPQNGEQPIPKVYASSSVRRYPDKKGKSGVPENENQLDRLNFQPEADLDEWEVKFLAVDPSIQRQGLASRLLALSEAEVRRRVEEEWLRGTAVNAEDGATQSTSPARKRIRVQLSTIKSIGFEFYLKRGYKWAEERNYPAGLFQAKEDWIMVWLDKILESSA